MISEIIKELRIQNELSQQQLGRLLGVTQQVVARWEDNQCLPNAKSILAIYNVFEITPNELLEIESVKSYKLKNEKTSIKQPTQIV